MATLGMTNASFVAQTADWIPSHLLQTLRAAYHHKGFGFVRILQRCPIWTSEIFEEAVRTPDMNEFLVHDDGPWVDTPDPVYERKLYHNPKDLVMARSLAEPGERIRLGVFYRNEGVPRYDVIRRLPSHGADERVKVVTEELDRFAV
jgi:2-oxoglutarate ferredoxin oxidoreductase subunit beta